MIAKAKMGLRFSPTAHSYWLDGKRVPGVTTILGVLDKPALPRWAATAVAEYVADHPDGVDSLRAMGRRPMVQALKEIPWQTRDVAAHRGTEVHALAATIAGGDEADVPDPLVGHVESYLRFLDDYGVTPVLLESAIGSREHRYAGTLDMVADSARHPRAIYDLKTSRSGIYAQTAWQNAAYGCAEFYGLDGDEQPMADLGIERSFGVHLRADGYDVHPLPYGPEVYAEFLTIRSAYDINKRAVGDWRRPGSGYVGVSEQNEETP